MELNVQKIKNPDLFKSIVGLVDLVNEAEKDIKKADNVLDFLVNLVYGARSIGFVHGFEMKKALDQYHVDIDKELEKRIDEATDEIISVAKKKLDELI